MVVRELSESTLVGELAAARARVETLEAALVRVALVVTAPSYLERGARAPRFVLNGREVLAVLQGVL